MMKKEVTYRDFNNEERTETLYFNLTEPEIVRIDVQYDGGLEAFIEQIDPETRPEEVLQLFETIIQGSYGEKSEDGRFFVKNDEAVGLFMQSAVYSALFTELIQDADTAAAFFTGVITKTTIDKPVRKPNGS